MLHCCVHHRILHSSSLAHYVLLLATHHPSTMYVARSISVCAHIIVMCCTCAACTCAYTPLCCMLCCQHADIPRVAAAMGTSTTIPQQCILDNAAAVDNVGHMVNRATCCAVLYAISCQEEATLPQGMLQKSPVHGSVLTLSAAVIQPGGRLPTSGLTHS